VFKTNIGPAIPGMKDTNMRNQTIVVDLLDEPQREIERLVAAEQTGGFGLNEQPVWSVVFEADGKRFRLAGLVQWTAPEANHLRYEARRLPDYFWGVWAKPF
jgi:hypothetical protein